MFSCDWLCTIFVIYIYISINLFCL
jgi:hypothetical protein